MVSKVFSRDVHVHCVTFLLHAQSVQQLTSQLEKLKEQKCHFEREYNRLLGSGEEVSCRPQESNGSEVLRLNGLLEKTERELFEARTQLEAKVSILHYRVNIYFICTYIQCAVTMCIAVEL